jgi:hypothetical protein
MSNGNPYGQGGVPPQHGYGPPGAGQGGPGYPMMPVTPIPLYAGQIRERSSAMVLLLGLFTCGVYHLYWLYKTTEELRNATGDTTLNPGTDLLITLLTCGVWGLFMQFRNAQKIHGAIATRWPQHQDQTQTVMILSLCTFVFPLTGLAAVYFVQEDLNVLAKIANQSV